MLKSGESILSVCIGNAPAFQSFGDCRRYFNSCDTNQQNNIAGFQISQTVNKIRAGFINIPFDNRATSQKKAATNRAP